MARYRDVARDVARAVLSIGVAVVAVNITNMPVLELLADATTSAGPNYLTSDYKRTLQLDEDGARMKLVVYNELCSSASTLGVPRLCRAARVSTKIVEYAAVAAGGMAGMPASWATVAVAVIVFCCFAALGSVHAKMETTLPHESRVRTTNTAIWSAAAMSVVCGLLALPVRTAPSPRYQLVSATSLPVYDNE